MLSSVPACGRVALEPGGEDVAVGIGIVVQDAQDGGAAGADADGVRLGFRRTVRFGAVRQDVDGVVVRGLLVLLVGFVLGRNDVVPVVDELHVLVHQPHIPGIHIIEDHQVPVHPKHIRRRRTRLRHIHVLIISIIDTIPDILIRPRPRSMHTPTQLHRSRRNTLTTKRHRLRRPTIQRLLQQRLLRRNRHKITARTSPAAASHPAHQPTATAYHPAKTTSPPQHPTPPAGPPPP